MNCHFFLISFTPQTNLFPLLKVTSWNVSVGALVYMMMNVCTHKVEIKADGNAIFNEVLIKRNERSALHVQCLCVACSTPSNNTELTLNKTAKWRRITK